MDQFSSQLANNLENGYTAGVPEHLIQVYKELSAWCELIQYKIDVDINTQDDIRKQVLSNNLLKHIQGLWQEKVNEFYNIKRDEARDNLSRACQNRINNCQKMMEKEPIVTHEELLPSNEEYFNDNDSLSSEEDYYHRIDNMPAETIIKDNKMVVVKYNSEPEMNQNIENYGSFEDEYEFDYGNENYEYYNDYDEYDEYDLHHYKQANNSKVTLNYPTVEENNDIYEHYREYIIRPFTPSLPEWTQEYEQNDSCSADFLNNWNFASEQNETYEECLSYTEQIMKEKEDHEDHLSYTEQIMREQRRLSHISLDSHDDDNESICSIKNIDRIQDLEVFEEEKETKEVEQDSENPPVNERRRLSIIIDDTVINGTYKKEKLSSDEHLYPRIVDESGESTGTTDNSSISPNGLLLSTTDEEFIYTSEKILTPLATEIMYSMNEMYSPEEKSESNSGLSTPEEPNPQILPKDKVNPPTIDDDDDTEKEDFQEEDLAKYLSSRRDSGFSETCDEPFVVNV